MKVIKKEIEIEEEQKNWRFRKQNLQILSRNEWRGRFNTKNEKKYVH